MRELGKMTMNKLGWFGAILLAFSGVPEAYRALIEPAYSISIPFVSMWLGGEICTLISVIKTLKAPYLLFNYSLNIVIISIILLRVTGLIHQIH